MRTPTWGEIEQFLAIDGGWQPGRSTKHGFYEKTLPNGVVLSTHVSHARDKSMHPDTFRDICRFQLQITPDEFWQSLESGKSARTTTPLPVEAKRPTLQMLRELQRKLHLSNGELEDMTFDDAKRRLDEFHSTYRP